MRIRNVCGLCLALAMTLAAQTAAYAGQMLFQDDFATLDQAWGEADAVVRAERGRLVVTPPENRGRTVLNQAFAFDEMTAEITMVNPNSDSAAGNGGLVFWAKDYNDYYVLWISGDGRIGVMRNLNGRWLQPVGIRPSEHVKRGPGQNQLKVVTAGSSATIYINGQQLVTFRGQAPQGGSFVGIFAEAPGTLEFADLRVSR